jgi:stage II sporulation protein M
MRSLYLKEWLFFKSRLFSPFLWLIVLAILFTCILFIFYSINPGGRELEAKKYVDKLKESGVYWESNLFIRTLKLYWVNLKAALLAILFGIIPFFIGVIIFIIIVISKMFGFYIPWALTHGYNAFSIAMKIVPHGIFELAGVFYAVSLGFFLSKETTKKLFSKYRKESLPFPSLFLQLGQSYGIVIAPLLALAAIIEEFITPLLN